MTIKEMKPGDRGRVIGWISDVVPARLMEMGLLPGAIVEVVRFAPLGDPIDLKVRGYHLSIRKEEAGLVQVEPI